MKIIFITILFISSLFANLTLENRFFNKVSLDSYTKQYIDESSNLSFEEIKNKEFKTISRFNHTATNSTIWSYFQIQSKEDLEIFFENIKAGVDLIDVYIVKNRELIQKFELGDYRNIEDREIKTKNSAFVLNIQKNTNYEFFIKHNSYGSISTLWYIYDKNSYQELLSFRSLIWGFFIGTIFILTFHNLFIYFSIKKRVFLFYALFIISSAIYQLLVNGVLYEYFKNIDLNILNGLKGVLEIPCQLDKIISRIDNGRENKL